MATIGTVRLIYEKIVATLLPGLVGLANTGIFSIAWRLMTSGKLGYFSAFTAIYPVMAKDVEMGRKMKGLIPLLGTSVAFSLLLQWFAKPIISLLFGEEYLPAVLSLQIMAWSIVPYVLVTYITLGLAALGLERPILISAVLALIALLVLLIPFTNQYGITGSSIAVLSAEIFYAGIIWLQWRKHVLSKLSG
jgi:O-antigen/teichoic acid export membrane protein